MNKHMLLPFIILIVLACIYAGSLKNPSSRLCVVVCVLIVILLLCALQVHGREGFLSGYSGYSPIGYTMRNGGSGVGEDGGCGGYNYKDINNQIGSTGTYDGIRLKSKIVTKPLLNSPVIFTPTGDGVPLTQPLGNAMYPTIDGQTGSPKFLFSLANNQSSWDCCPSPFGSDGGDGCVCLSEEQLAMFSRRGGNKTKPVEYPEM